MNSDPVLTARRVSTRWLESREPTEWLTAEDIPAALPMAIASRLHRSLGDALECLTGEAAQLNVWRLDAGTVDAVAVYPERSARVRLHEVVAISVDSLRPVRFSDAWVLADDVAIPFGSQLAWDLADGDRATSLVLGMVISAAGRAASLVVPPEHLDVLGPAQFVRVVA